MAFMGRIYKFGFENATIAAASGDIDLFYIAPAADKPVQIVGCYIGPTGTADMGDAQEEGLRICIVRGHTTVGSGGNAVTATPTNPNEAAAGATCRTLDTTVASAGTGLNLTPIGVNNRGGWDYTPTPEMYDMCTATTGGRIVVRLMGAVADDLTLSGWLAFEEL